MPRPPRKKTLLVASLDPQLAEVRKQVLEEAGYRVITAKTTIKVRTVCQRQQVDLVMIGYSLPLAEKLRVILLGEPPRPPGLGHAQPESVRMNFLAHAFS